MRTRTPRRTRQIAQIKTYNQVRDELSYNIRIQYTLASYYQYLIINSCVVYGNILDKEKSWYFCAQTKNE